MVRIMCSCTARISNTGLKEKSSICQFCQKPRQDFDNSSRGPNFFRCATPMLRSPRCGYEINYLMNKYLINVPVYPDTTLGSEDTAKNKINTSLLTQSLHSSVRRP